MHQGGGKVQRADGVRAAGNLRGLVRRPVVSAVGAGELGEQSGALKDTELRQLPLRSAHFVAVVRALEPIPGLGLSLAPLDGQSGLASIFHDPR